MVSLPRHPHCTNVSQQLDDGEVNTGKRTWGIDFHGSYVLNYIVTDQYGPSDLVNTVGYPLRVRFENTVWRTSGDFEFSATLFYYSTVTLFARLRGWSTSVPFRIAT